MVLVLKEENRVRNFLVRNRASSPSLEGLLIGMAAVWGVAPAQGVNHGGRHPPTRGRHSADQRRDQHPTSASRRTLWRCLQGGGSVRKTKISIAIWLSGRIRRDGGCWGRTIRTGVPREHEGRSWWWTWCEHSPISPQLAGCWNVAGRSPRAHFVDPVRRSALGLSDRWVWWRARIACLG